MGTELDERHYRRLRAATLYGLSLAAAGPVVVRASVGHNSETDSA
jgi:hypothetical protein